LIQLHRVHFRFGKQVNTAGNEKSIKVSINRERVISFLLLTLPANGAIQAMLTLVQGFIEHGFKVDIVV
jgi:hypothetical protein